MLLLDAVSVIINGEIFMIPVFLKILPVLLNVFMKIQCPIFFQLAAVGDGIVHWVVWCELRLSYHRRGRGQPPP
jgi:hypothetical protein